MERIREYARRTHRDDGVSSSSSKLKEALYNIYYHTFVFGLEVEHFELCGAHPSYSRLWSLTPTSEKHAHLSATTPPGADGRACANLIYGCRAIVLVPQL